MSGVGEALAIVSAVAGLIQAYDAGSRIFRQIKARRLAHDALPPSDHLEESVEEGKRAIEELVAKGTKRFGPSFKEGDVTAQLALYQITIATQNALLESLAEARYDDGVIDFDTCIDTSDKARMDALGALADLYKRKLEEEQERKKRDAASESQQQQQQQQAVQQQQQQQQRPPQPKPDQKLSPPPQQPTQPPTRPGQTAPAQPVPAPKLEQTPSPNPPPKKVKKSRTFNDVFRRKESGSQSATPMDTIPQAAELDPSPRASQQDMPIPHNPRRNTAASTSSSNTFSSMESRNSTVGYEDSVGLGVLVPTTNTRSDTGFSSMTTVSRHGTTVSTLSTATTISPITKYGGFCKHAYDLREGSIKKGLSLAPASVYSGKLVYKCTSSKCQFTGNAIHDKSGYHVNDKIFSSPSGIQWRWMFLAKSHIQQKEPKDPSFRCLICLMLGDDSGIWHGHDVLLAHLSSHQGALLGGTRLEGPLVFTNHGVHPDLTDDFDVRFPIAETHGSHDKPEVQRGGAAVVVAGGPTQLDLGTRVSGAVSSKVPTAFAYEAGDNPWA